ncbi:hypothetical protein LMG33818_001954 [Halomonadaceae bacterium LMG 33818]|uniref:hypothetical protein n=1 Tax=Cernens ardua TaxID=3402176 RepID=UPI003EDBA19D
MNTKVVGKSLLGIVSLIVLVVSLTFILCGIYIECTQQNGTGYELAFVSLIVFAFALWANLYARKGLNTAQFADEQASLRKRKNSDAPMLRTGDESDTDHEMPKLHLSSEDEHHETLAYSTEEQHTGRQNELGHVDASNHEEASHTPPKWWYADNREEPTLKFAHRHDAVDSDEAGPIVVRQNDDDLHEESDFEREDESEYQQEPVSPIIPNDQDDESALKSKHGWFGFEEYEEPEWVEEEISYSEKDEVTDEEYDQPESISNQSTPTATLHDKTSEGSHGNHNLEQAPSTIQGIHPAPQQKPRIRVTAKVQETIPKN